MVSDKGTLLFFREFLFKRVKKDLVADASKLVLKNNKVFALRGMLTVGEQVHCVMKVNLF